MQANNAIPAFRRLAPAEARERRQKGLCFHYDERYTPSHKCKTQQLFWVEGLMQDRNEDDGQHLELLKYQLHIEPIEDDPAPQISLHAIAGTKTPQTMRIVGRLRHCTLTILIDSGSTHNFIDPIVIRKAQVPTQSDAIFEVMVANG